MKKYIHVTKEVRLKLMAIFGVGDRVVWNALNFHKERGMTDTAKRIRECAKKNGGIVMNELPEVETLHDADGYMRQYFPNGAMLECNKKDGHVDLLYKGCKVTGFDDVKISQLENIQYLASIATEKSVEGYAKIEAAMAAV